MKKRNQKYVWIIIGIAIIIGILAFSGVFKSDSNTLSTTNTFSSVEPPLGTYINVPTFMYYKCEQALEKKSSPDTNIANGIAPWVTCPENSANCDIVVQSTENNWWDLLLGRRRLVYQICDYPSLTNCQAQVYRDNSYWTNRGGIPTFTIPLLKSQAVYINYQVCSNFILSCLFWGNSDGAKFHADYEPFILWKYPFTGGGWEYTTIQQGCNFPTSSSQIKPGETLRTSNYNLNSVSNLQGLSIPQQTSTDDSKVPPYKTRNFIDGFTPMAVENVNFVNVNGQIGYCTNNVVYSIGEVKTKSGTYKVVDVRYNTILNPSVTCCPGDTKPGYQCNSNFEWIPTSQSQCDNGFNPCRQSVPIPAICGQKKLVFYSCVNPGQTDSFCQQQTQDVECTCNADCVGNSKGDTCDTKSWECTDLPVPPINCPLQCNVDSDCDACPYSELYDFKCESGKCIGKEKPNPGDCENCIKWAGNLFKPAEQKCTPKGTETTWWNPLTWFNFTGLFSQNLWCPILFACSFVVGLFGFLFSLSFLERFKYLNGRKSWAKLVIALILGTILAVITYIAFLLGIIIFIVYLIISLAIKYILPTKFLRR